MFDQNHQQPPGTPLGKAKALEVVILQDGTRMPKKSKVRYWCEKKGAKEDFFIIHQNKIYHLTSLEFKRRFKVIIKGGVVQLPRTDPS